MKIAIPADKNSLSADVYASLARAPFFAIYDTDTTGVEFIDNSAASSQGGAGIKAAQILVDSHVDVLITPRCGQNAADAINAAKIQMYKSIDHTISDNLKAWEEEKLELLNDIHPGFHGHGG
ncbi:MAG: dinitrogenase iron-molybdenum cofactor biosynthesis protein [Firmicutes bacterium HGW-Firmicutes-18]|nr:MAG: dinitrogenase iron-molybdenum cofactor biosynthesis protein [Firmicutes bacterium HGW-Firmicutes-18]